MNAYDIDMENLKVAVALGLRPKEDAKKAIEDKAKRASEELHGYVHLTANVTKKAVA